MLEFIRGDTFAFKFKIKTGNEILTSKEEIETLFITCRKYTKETSKINFEKKIDDIEIDEEGYFHVKFNPEDTEKMNYGVYFFDIEVTLKNGYRKTKLFKFKITEETTIHGGGANGN